MTTVALPGTATLQLHIARGPLGERANVDYRADMIGNATVVML